VTPKKDHLGISLIFPNNWLLKQKIWLGYDTNIEKCLMLVGLLIFGDCVLNTGVTK